MNGIQKISLKKKATIMLLLCKDTYHSELDAMCGLIKHTEKHTVSAWQMFIDIINPVI